MFNPSQLYMPMRSLAPIARKTINWAGLLANTQKTLNIVNQTIPIVHQVRPMINNARTMLRVASELTKSTPSKGANSMNNNIVNNSSNNDNNNVSSSSYTDIDTNGGPSFFI